MKKMFTAMLLSFTIAFTLISCGQSGLEPEKLPSESSDSQVNLPTVDDQQDNSETLPTRDPEQSGMCENKFCTVHCITYHSVPGILIDMIGEDAFYEWVTPLESVDTSGQVGDCPASWNICDVIEHFQISREDLEELYFTSSWLYCSDIWDFDLLYGDDERAADQFYRNVDELREISAKREALLYMKEDIYLDYQKEWEENFGTFSLASLQVSMVEIVRTFDIPRERLERYAEVNVVPDYTSYDYDFDLIYGQSAGIQSISQYEADPYPVLACDAAFCGIDDYRLE